MTGEKSRVRTGERVARHRPVGLALDVEGRLTGDAVPWLTQSLRWDIDGHLELIASHVRLGHPPAPLLARPCALPVVSAWTRPFPFLPRDARFVAPGAEVDHERW